VTAAAADAAADVLDVDLAPLVQSFWAPLLPATVARWVVALSLWVLAEPVSGPWRPVRARGSYGYGFGLRAPHRGVQRTEEAS
jgi:hypothetical protein